MHNTKIFEGKPNNLEGVSLEDRNRSTDGTFERNCKLCNNRLLSCLRTFCQSCLTKLLNDNKCKSPSVSTTLSGNSDSTSYKESTPLPILPEVPQEPLHNMADASANNSNDSHGSVKNSVTATSPKSMTSSKQSKCENDLLATDLYLPPFAPSPGLPSIPSGIWPVDNMKLATLNALAASNTKINANGRNKASPIQIRCKFGSFGDSGEKFCFPQGFCLTVDDKIVVADTNNHCVKIFDKCGSLIFQFGVPGKKEGQLWYPRRVAVMHTNVKFVVCDRGNASSRMQIFSTYGNFIRNINISRFISIVTALAVTSKGNIVVVDSVCPTIFVLSEEGDLLHFIDCRKYIFEPSDIAIHGNDYYVCDFKGHCVAVFQEDGKFKYRFGNEKVICFPNGIAITSNGDVLIGDSHGNRLHIAVYTRDGKLQSEFECPEVKVSRCCGLQITSEGYVVTLAKNNHYVLVLNNMFARPLEMNKCMNIGVQIK